MGVELNLFKCEKATRRALWGQRGIERGKKRENKAAHKRGGDGRKNMPVAGKRNQTSSLLTQAHREEERGQITDEHCGSKMGKKIKKDNK